MQDVWTENYPAGVERDPRLDEYASLAELFYDSVEKYKEKIAYRNLGTTYTYGELSQKVKSLAAYFQQELELEPGDRIALMMPNILPYPVALFAALIAGLVVVNLNPQYTAQELLTPLKDAEVKAVVVLSILAQPLQAVLSHLATPKIIAVSMTDGLPWYKAFLLKAYLKWKKKLKAKKKIPDSIDFSKALSKGKKLIFQPVHIKPSDLAFLQYTGGTTGTPKGAMLSHGNMVANVAQASSWLAPILKPGKETIITALPLYHIFSLMANCILFIKWGAENVLITDPRDLDRFVSTLKKVPFSALTGVNTLFNALIHHTPFKTLDFSNLKLVLGGGMAVQRAVAENFKEITGVPILEAYGLTETSPGVAINPLHLKDFSGCVGMPLPKTEISIRDEHGEEVPLSQPGILWVKGPQVMQGYWQHPEETEQVLKEGWFNTGDIAVMDSHGYLSIVDRAKDMILVSGFNVYPNEVEEVCAQCTGVKEVAAIGSPHPVAGEVVHLFVVKEDPALTKTDIIEHAKRFLIGYKVPKIITFKDALPKSNVGKIIRQQLRTND